MVQTTARYGAVSLVVGSNEVSLVANPVVSKVSESQTLGLGFLVETSPAIFEYTKG